MSSKSERNVEFGFLPEGGQQAAINQQQKQDSNIGLVAIAEAVPQFTKVMDFTTFTAEYAMVMGALVVHFFIPPDFKGDVRYYWTMVFPRALDKVAQDHFNARSPRLQAKFTSELNSWWFRARGYDHILDIPKYVTSFFTALDAALETPA